MKSNSTAPRRRTNVRAKVRAAAVVMLHDRPEGVRFTELVDSLQRMHPDRTVKAIGNDIVGLDRALPTQVVKPIKGLYLHSRFHTEAPSREGKDAPRSPARRQISEAVIPEQQFYASFGTWLKDDLEEVTHVIVLGGNIFRSKWGTPDVLGKYEAKRSDMVKGMTLIVASEVKVDIDDLLRGFGQACAYLLFAHKSFLVVPSQTPPDELDRLEALCRIHGIGLVTFDARNAAKPGYRLLTRPTKYEPDLSYTNRYMRLVEGKLFT